jgi:phage baseplate assembly protein W
MANITEVLKTDLYHDRDLVKTEIGGDIQTLSGLENMKAALLRRLMTEPGTVIHRPLYGVGMKQFQNASMTLSNQRAIALKINEQFIRDERVEKVLGVSINSSDTRPELLTIVVRVKLVGYEEQELSFTPFNKVAG